MEFLMFVMGFVFGVFARVIVEQNEKEKVLEQSMVRVDIVSKHGNVERGWAKELPHLNGWEVYCSSKILKAFGTSDGTFPNGTPWNWSHFAFVKEEKQN